MSRLAGLVALVLAVVLIPSASGAPVQPITALAPVEIWAARFGSPWGIAVDSAGNVYVADREAGTVTRIAPDRRRVLVAAGLQHPSGLTFDLDGRLLIAEERAGRVVRVEADGRRTPVMSDVKQPRWLAVSDTGRLFVSARRLPHDTDPEPDDESAEPEMILTVGSDGRPALFAYGFKQLQALATGEGVVYAAARGRREDTRAAGVVFQIPILADGSAGLPTRLGLSDTFKRPIGLARDRLGALYLTTKELGAVGKLHHDATATRFASNLDDPKGLAFDTDGNLYVADGRSGRVVRFLAPPAPGLTELPAYTNQTTLNVLGTTEPAARVDVFVNDDTTSVVGAANAAGAFAVPVTLAPNTEHVLEMFATGHAGDGLTSAPAEARITHDGIPPALAFQAPLAGAFVRQTVPVAAQASDGGSRLGSLVLSVGVQGLGGSVAPLLPAPSAVATATWNTIGVVDGTQTLVATAVDRVGNSATVPRTVIVDNTPPTVQITGGPVGTVQGTTALFTFTGADNLTPIGSLQFAWRLDGGAWSAFGSTTSATIAGLAQGPHLFEVKAHDLAGNESLAPAQRAFTVSTLRVTITEPANGATVPSGSLLVRGTVDAGGEEAGVTVNSFPAAIQGGTFAALVTVTGDTTGLAAVATTSGGGTATENVAIMVSNSSLPAPVLIASPGGGVAPLTVGFTLGGVPSGTEVRWDFDGDGTVDSAGPYVPGQGFTYLSPGVYVVTAQFVDQGGNSRIARAVVNVWSRAALEVLLQAKWAGMKDALRTGDISRALAYIAQSARARYDEAFRLITRHLPNIDAILTDLQSMEVFGTDAFFDAVRIDAGRPMAFEVRFIADSDGVWRIEGF